MQSPSRLDSISWPLQDFRCPSLIFGITIQAGGIMCFNWASHVCTSHSKKWGRSVSKHLYNNNKRHLCFVFGLPRQWLKAKLDWKNKLPVNFRPKSPLHPRPISSHIMASAHLNYDVSWSIFFFYPTQMDVAFSVNVNPDASIVPCQHEKEDLAKGVKAQSIIGWTQLMSQHIVSLLFILPQSAAVSDASLFK